MNCCRLTFIVVALLNASNVCLAAENVFADDKHAPLQVTEAGVQRKGSVTIKDISFAGANGESLRAYLVLPEANGRHPALLYSHWLAPEANSNRTQFLGEATTLAENGVVSLLLDMPWAERGWFRKRKLAGDYNLSVNVVKNLHRAIDLLISLEGVDSARIGFVGHDFGASYGAILFGIDPRVHCAVFMAGTPILSDWFLLERNLPEPQKRAYIAKLAPLDPIHFVGKSKHSQALFQFGSRDVYISRDKALLFAKAASGLKDVRWYEADHALCEQAKNDRVDWLTEQLGVGKQMSSLP